MIKATNSTTMALPLGRGAGFGVCIFRSTSQWQSHMPFQTQPRKRAKSTVKNLRQLQWRRKGDQWPPTLNHLHYPTSKLNHYSHAA
jgi:hypothetical protein